MACCWDAIFLLEYPLHDGYMLDDPKSKHVFYGKNIKMWCWNPTKLRSNSNLFTQQINLLHLKGFHLVGKMMLKSQSPLFIILNRKTYRSKELLFDVLQDQKSGQQTTQLYHWIAKRTKTSICFWTNYIVLTDWSAHTENYEAEWASSPLHLLL